MTMLIKTPAAVAAGTVLATSAFALACDMRFGSREKAILSQWEVGAGLAPGVDRWRDSPPHRSRTGTRSAARRG